MEASHKTHRPHIKVGKHEEEDELYCCHYFKGKNNTNAVVLFFYSYGQNYTVGPNQPGISIAVDWGTLLLHVQILHRAIHLNFKLG